MDPSTPVDPPPSPAPADGLRVLRSGPVVELRLARPGRRNALSAGLVEALRREHARAAADPQVSALVLTAEGSHFCAGGDLSDGPGGDGFFAQHEARGSFARLLQALVEGPLPVVAAVQGDALGGGAGLVAACTLVVMAPGASLRTPELSRGLFPWMIAPVLARKLPRNVLNELILLGEPLSAARAAELGLVNRLAPVDRVEDEARALAMRIAGLPPAVLRMGWGALAEVEDLPLAAALARMHAGLSLNLLTEDAAEGIAAFLARRPPRWTGR